MAVGNTIGKLTAEPMLPKSTPAGSANPPEKKSWWSKWGDVVHTGLDILGAVPVVGIVADGANAAIYAAEGDYVNAAISGASAAANLIPGGGAAMKAGKAAVAVGKTVAKEGAEALAKKAAKEAAEKAAKEAAEKAAKEGAEAAGKKTAKNAGSDAGGGVKGKGKKKPACKAKVCVGMPINPVLGIKFLNGPDERDFDLPAPLPLPWQRSYFSDQQGNGWLGQGWSLPLSSRLQRRSAGLVAVDEQGFELELPELDEGESDYDRYEATTLTRESNGRYRLSSNDSGLHKIFAPLDLDAADPVGERCSYLPLVALEDRNGNRVRILYDDSGYPCVVQDSAGRLLALQFRALDGTAVQRRLVGVALLHGETDVYGNGLDERAEPLVGYDYDSAGDLVGVRDARHVLRREYRYTAHILTGHSWPGGLSASYEYDRYDTRGKVLRHSTSVGLSWRFDYWPEATVVTDVIGRQTRYEFNVDKELTAVVDARGGRATIQLNAWGKPVAVTDPGGQCTRYQYDAEGNLVALIDAAGARTELEYDERWQLPTALTDPAGATTRLDYDAAGNLIRRTDAGGHVTAYNHDARGLVLRITDAHGGRQTFEYDRYGQVVAQTDCLGALTRRTWDSRGNQLSIEQPDGSRTAFAYDDNGRLTRVAYADGTAESYVYDDIGRLVRHVDAAGNATAWELAPDGLVVARTDALGGRLSYQYDAARRLVVLTNENGAHYRFAYDANDNVVAEQGFDGRVIRFVFDASDRLIERQELGTHAGPGVDLDPDNIPELLRTRYVRDSVGRMIEKVAGRARDKRTLRTQYGYDAAGRLVLGVSPGGRVTFGYDALGQLIEETSLSQGRAQSVQYRYDGLGNRVETVLPDGRRLAQRYYGSGHLDRISLDGAVISDIERDVMQRETVRSQGALRSYFDYDAIGRRVAQRARKDGVAAPECVARRYVYDRNGNLHASVDQRFGQIAYQYDALGRLTRANAERFAFDPAHNLVDPGAAAVRGNRLLQFEDKRFAYDTHGNLVEKHIGSHSLLRFSYDPEHRLQSAIITRNGVTQRFSYGYDAFGRRTWKRDSFGITAFVWDGNRLLQETRRSRRFTYVYEPGSFIPLAQLESPTAAEAEGGAPDGVVRYFHNDNIGTPREISEADGRISWRASYRAWGNTLLVEYPEQATPVVAEAEPPHQPLRFQGQYFDAETGLHYNRFRYYDPDVGRYISQDPIGLAGGLNTFAYAANPTVWMDPLGLTAEKLARNLAAAGRPVGAGQTPHHVVQENCGKNDYVQHSRDLLGRHDVDIDSASNGARLWGTSNSQVANPNHPGRAAARATGNYHAGSHVHSTMNDKLIYRILRNAEKKGLNVANVLEDIGQRLESGAWKKAFECCCK
jgi:RHS repeat-associated protein